MPIIEVWAFLSLAPGGILLEQRAAIVGIPLTNAAIWRCDKRTIRLAKKPNNTMQQHVFLRDAKGPG